MKKIKVLSLFAGIGAFEKALRNIDVDFELVGYSELSKEASRAYASIHGVSESLNYGDVKNVPHEGLPDFNVMTWSFPCVGFSMAQKEDKRTGLNNDDSGLYYEGLRILKENKPMISIIENVPDLISDKFKGQFDSIISDLNDCGYVSKYAVLNGTDYNIPQSRSRLFIVSIRQDVYKGFEFPLPIELTVKGSDYLEEVEDIDEKFLRVNPVIIERIKVRNIRDVNVCPTITKAIGRAGSSSEYISNCAFVYKNTGIIRRMTPKETMLFTGFSEEDYVNAKKVSSDSQIYNFSGNSICVPVLEHIFYRLLIEYGYENILLEEEQSSTKYSVAEQLEFQLF